MKVKISTANASKKTLHHLPSTHLTTQDVGQICPINILPTTPGDVFHIDLTQLSQSVPTAVKTFGAFYLRTFAFFVFYRVVFFKFEDFLSQSVDSSIDSAFPPFTLWHIYHAMFGMEGTVGTDVSFSSTTFAQLESRDTGTFGNGIDAHFIVENPDVPQEDFKFRLTSKGRFLFKILVGLGYEIPLYLKSNELSHINNFRYSLLPLLSFARFFYDWVYPSSYVNQQGFGYLFDNNFSTNDRDLLIKILDVFFVPMEQDFFNSLWLKPNNVSAGSTRSPEHTVTFDSSTTLKIGANNNSAYVRQKNSDYTSSPFESTSMTSESLRWLENLSDFVVRNQIGGQRFREWMKAHFGFVTAPQDSHRSTFLKSFNDSLNFSAVTATSDSGSTLLGDRAGVGNSQGHGKMKFEALEHGFLMFASMVVPSTGYYQGMKPWCGEISSPFDFYTPELDNVGMEAVPYRQIFSSYQRPEDSNALPVTRLNDAFGFAPRYTAMYKIGYDYLSGDFRLRSRNTNLDAFHTFRDVLWNRTSDNQLANDAQFKQADSQYDRIFAVNPIEEQQYDNPMYDKIETMYLFDVKKYSSQLSVGDSMPIFNKSGRDVTLDNQGQQL